MLAASVAAVVAYLAIRPDLGAPLSYDAYVSTLHFDRIASGHRLEAQVLTTPKPLLTLMFGVAHALGGWGLVGILSILAWGASVGVASLLALRLAGPGAGAAAAALLVASPTLLLETGWGLGTVWAIGIWSAAALAVTGERRRWAVCGALLGLATLVRIETVLIDATVLVVVAAAWLATRRLQTGALLAVAVALWALPVMLLHDLALTGDPLYFAEVSGLYGTMLSSIGALPGPGAVASMAVSPVTTAPVVALLAVVGVVALVRARQAPVLVGMLALGLGVGLALPALAATGRLADSRYLEPIRFSLLLAAAVGVGWIVRAGGRRLERDRPASSSTRRRAVVLAAAAIGLGVGLIAAPVRGPVDAPTLAVIGRFRSLAVSADVARPTLAGVLAASPSAAAWPGTSHLPDRSRLDLFAVPGNVRARLALDLGIPLTRIVSTNPLQMDVADGDPPPGEIVVHSGGDEPPQAFALFESPASQTVGGVMLQPLLADPGQATWVVAITPLGGGPQPAPVPR